MWFYPTQHKTVTEIQHETYYASTIKCFIFVRDQMLSCAYLSCVLFYFSHAFTKQNLWDQNALLRAHF